MNYTNYLWFYVPIVMSEEMIKQLTDSYIKALNLKDYEIKEADAEDKRQKTGCKLFYIIYNRK